MKERPILFSGEMVRAILDGRKTQTRRIVRDIEYIGGRGEEHDPASWGYAFDGPDHHGWMVIARGKCERFDHGLVSIPCPYGEPGDLLWVREAFALHRIHDGSRPSRVQPTLLGAVTYSADAPGAPPDGFGRRWRPSIHMPRWASRITLRVTDVRVQRVQEISEDDAKAEGLAEERDEWWSAYDPETSSYPEFFADPTGMRGMRLESIRKHERVTTAAENFRGLWHRINGARAPWASNPWVWAVSFERVPS